MGSLQYWVSVYIVLQRKENPIEFENSDHPNPRFLSIRTRPRRKDQLAWDKGNGAHHTEASGSGCVELVPGCHLPELQFARRGAGVLMGLSDGAGSRGKCDSARKALNSAPTSWCTHNQWFIVMCAPGFVGQAAVLAPRLHAGSR